MKSLKLLLCFSIGTLLSPTVLAQSFPMPSPMPSKPLSNSQVITKVALGSCFVPQFEEHHIFDTIKAAKPDVFLFMGDNVYQTKETHDLHLPYLKEGYGYLVKSKPFAEFRKTTPVLPMWDDHDYGMNDAGGSYKPKYTAEKIFEHVWAIDKAEPMAQRDGVYYSKTVGPVGRRLQMIMLDTRFFRTDVTRAPKDDPKKRVFEISTDPQADMLGKAQWQWLEQQLNQPADFRLLVSSVQVLSGEGYSEGWYLMPKQQARLLKLLEGHKNLLIVSGDRHYANSYQRKLNKNHWIMEITASSLNSPISSKYATRVEQAQEPYQSGTPIMQANFGLLNIDWQNKNVAIEFRDDKGGTLRRLVTSFK